MMRRIAAALLLLPLLAACDGGTEPDDSVVVLRPEPTVPLEAYPLDTISETLVVRAIRITEAGEEPAAGIEIGWSTDREMSAVVPAVTVTDAEGYARVRWRLGVGSGAQRTIARVLNGTAMTRFDAVAIQGLRAVTLQQQVFATHTCAASENVETWCWGTNRSGQLGTGVSGNGDFDVPQRVVGSQRFVALRGMEALSCGLTESGELWCWGSTYGWIFGSEPTRFMSGIAFRSLSMSGNVVCGIDFGNAGYCWGRGMLGDGIDDHRNIVNEPKLISAPSQWSEIAVASHENTFGVSADGNTYAWGIDWGENYKLYGVEHEGALVSPVAVPLVPGISGLATSYYFRCALRDGAAVCWGLLNPWTDTGPGPVTVMPPEGQFTQLAATGVLVAGLSTSGQVYVWGSGVPLTRLPGEGPWSTISTGIGNSFCAILAADSTVYCWTLQYEAPFDLANFGLGIVRLEAVPAPDEP